MKRYTFSKPTVCVCAIAWMILSFGVCGNLDCDLMTVGQAQLFILKYTASLVGISFIAYLADLFKERKSIKWD